MKTTYNRNEATFLDKLVGKLQLEDRRNLMIMRNFQWFMWIMAPLYLLIFIAAPFGEVNRYERIGGICFSLAFLFFAFIFRKYKKVYSQVDYGLPTFKMLTLAVKRYNLHFSRIAMTLIPVLIIDLGMFFMSFPYDRFQDIIHFQVIYLGLIVVAIIAGMAIWRIREKPLRDAAKSLLSELELE